MTFVGLADCNSFYASCERIFRPDLKNRPIVVLSNNDGCIVALSKEAKQLGITRGTPYFKIKDFLYSNGVAVFSSNYTLYQDISDRFYSLLNSLTGKTEKYSIDESFFLAENMPESKACDYAASLAGYLHQGTGIPVSIGMARTKTLAKIANHIAKKGSYSFVMFPEDEEEILKKTPITDVWGIGWRSVPKAIASGIETAWDFACCNDDFLLKKFTVCGYNTAQELRGKPSVRKLDPAHLSVSSSISFSEPVSSLSKLETALACHCTTVCSKLFADQCEAKDFAVQLLTNRFGKDYSNTFATVSSESPTGYLPDIVKLLNNALKSIFRPNLYYKSMRVIAWNLYECKNKQNSLFDSELKLKTQEKQKALSQVVFRGDGKLVCSSTNFTSKFSLTNSKLLSPMYTTRWDSLPRCI